MKREKTVVVGIHPDICRRPGCNRHAEVIGLCKTDYHVAWSLVESGVTTWDALRKAGKVAERKRNAKEWFLEGGKAY